MKCLTFVVCFWGLGLSGCYYTEGSLKLKGKVLDNFTNAAVSNRTILVLADGKNNQELDSSQVIGKFSADSLGCFSYTLSKIKGVSLYNFYVVGDTSFASSNNLLGLYELNRDAEFLSFKVRALTDLKIKLTRITKSPVSDALYVSWKSGRTDGKMLYPGYVVNNGIVRTKRLEWVGNKTDAVIHTKVYAEENTIMRFMLFRDGRYKEFVDTVFCFRDVNNSILFRY